MLNEVLSKLFGDLYIHAQAICFICLCPKISETPLSHAPLHSPIHRLCRDGLNVQVFLTELELDQKRCNFCLGFEL